MGGADVLLGVQWLQSLGMIAFNFQELFLNLFWEGKEVELRGIKGILRKIINSNNMTKLLNKEKQGIISQLCSLEDPTSKSCISPYQITCCGYFPLGEMEQMTLLTSIFHYPLKITITVFASPGISRPISNTPYFLLTKQSARRGYKSLHALNN